ncbi:MAG: hypothetical protein PHT08_08820, partial [Bacteroidales bacterium]|nr:hypothetical protein [Bacteroidales bacterium]
CKKQGENNNCKFLHCIMFDDILKENKGNKKAFGYYFFRNFTLCETLIEIPNDYQKNFIELLNPDT